MDDRGNENSSQARNVLTEDKLKQIRTACAAGDIDALVSLAGSPNGFIDDESRRIAWPVLLGISRDTPAAVPSSWADLPPHPDEHQVKLDVDRSFIYYPLNKSEKTLASLKQDLLELITETLRRHPFLSYPQGYHDIVQVLLLVLGRKSAPPAAERLSILRVRDFMQPSILPTLDHLRLLLPILHLADPEIERHVSQNDPAFALAATLTLYAHHIETYGDIARLFDFLLASQAAMPVYLFAAIIVSRRSELFEIEPGAPEMLSILQRLPEPLDLEALISHSLRLSKSFPPEKLPGQVWRRVSAYSVLKTTRDFHGLSQQTLKDGEKFFNKHAAQVQMSQRILAVQTKLWRLRRPAGTVGFAVIVAILAWNLRNGNSSGPISAIWEFFKNHMW